MAGPLHVAYEGPDGRIIVTDSLTYCDQRIKTIDVVVGGSFIGEYPAAVALSAGAKGLIGNAAGVGRDSAGIAGLSVGDRFGAPCAAVHEQSARLADGPDTYQSGEISHANAAARRSGVEPGMSCQEAAACMLAADEGVVGRAAELVQAERHLVYDGPDGRVWAMASVGLAAPECADGVVCAGSHTALVTWRYVSGYGFPIAGVICSDGGVGKDESGISGLAPLAAAGVLAASVAGESARIGDGRSTFNDGVIRYVNDLARAAGVAPGMAAREAALLMLRHRHARVY